MLFLGISVDDVKNYTFGSVVQGPVTLWTPDLIGKDARKMRKIKVTEKKRL